MQVWTNCILVSLTLAACGSVDSAAFSTESKELQLLSVEDGIASTLSAAERSGLLDKKAKKIVQNVLKQMPCGWPEYGIPPLAPYTNADLNIHIAESLLQMIRFRLDGLDDMQIKKLKVSYALKKEVEFEFNFKELKATAAIFNVDLVDILGINFNFADSGALDFALQNLSLKGKFKYKMPILFGSIEIYKFSIVISLGSVRSHITGILGNGRMNAKLNKELEYWVPAIINGNKEAISARIEKELVPRINERLKGNKIWSVLSALLHSSPKCRPNPPPW